MATKRKSSTKSKRKTSKTTGRGSPEAVAKRKAARQLNALVQGGTKKALDGRTEARRKRLVKALKGDAGKKLKPIDKVQATHDLLEIGESIASLKKQGVTPTKVEVNDELLAVVADTQKAYGFDPQAWRILGLRVDAEGKVIAKKAATKGGARKARKSPAKKKSASKRK